MWESAVGESAQLIIEVVCRDFALQGFNVKAIKNREGEDCLRAVHGGRKELHVQELKMERLGIHTLADFESMVCDTISIDHTEYSLPWGNAAMWAGLSMVAK